MKRKFHTVFRRKKIVFYDPAVYRISDFCNASNNAISKRNEEETNENDNSELSECKKILIMLGLYAYVAYIFTILHYFTF